MRTIYFRVVHTKVKKGIETLFIHGYNVKLMMGHVGLKNVVFGEKGKPETSRSKEENQETQPTRDAGPEETHDLQQCSMS